MFSKLRGAMLALLLLTGCHSKNAEFKNAMEAYLVAADQMIAALDNTSLSPAKTDAFQASVESAFDKIPLYPPGNEELEKAFRSADKMRLWLQKQNEFVRLSWYNGQHIPISWLPDANRRLAEIRQRLES